MDKFDRIYELDRILKSRRYPVSLKTLVAELECSEPTVKRIIRHFRERLGAPIDYDPEHQGYCYARDETPRYELPGLWFNAEELHALLTTYHLLGGIQEGLLDEYIQPLRERLERLLRDERIGADEIEKRVRILPLATRQTDLKSFRRIAGALMQRRRLRMLYHGRARDAITERVVSPQRLVYYRDNWYLDAWCHLREGPRSFAVDRIQPVEVLEEAALERDEDELDRHYAAAYGIFAGPADKLAHLMFSQTAARWVADEHWHPRQQGEVLWDGRYELKIPYSEPTELIMDILKYGPEVEVLGPEELRHQVQAQLEAALARYQ
ncbi:transcriptional regulator [Thiohalobacter sp. COW1]|uniref:helix-turn-helix transcriptional regulator n=1 Tax=Thiohalobacter sp. COW1 TaxID=2795687 RepID=UPI0019155FDD|nr:WYL domain-containing protein [Thiohalobacter sp. COW1]BCO32891.1 transcriptional regulator [Thiohalobacter sp. COW1]